MFRFANPQYLWLLVVLPLFAALFWFAAHRRRKRLERFGHPAILKELTPEWFCLPDFFRNASHFPLNDAEVAVMSEFYVAFCAVRRDFAA